VLTLRTVRLICKKNMETSVRLSSWGLCLNRLRLLHSMIILCHLLLKHLLTAREISLRLLPHGCQKPALVPHILQNVIKTFLITTSHLKIKRLHIVIIKIQQKYLQILTPNVNVFFLCCSRKKSGLNVTHWVSSRAQCTKTVHPIYFTVKY
jgi:hypothetical protein